MVIRKGQVIKCNASYICILYLKFVVLNVDQTGDKVYLMLTVIKIWGELKLQKKMFLLTFTHSNVTVFFAAKVDFIKKIKKFSILFSW